MATAWGVSWGDAWGDAWLILEVEAPAPAPAPHAAPINRLAIRIDGRLHVGTYQEIASLVEQLAQQDAQQDRPQPSKVKAKAVVRRSASDLKRRLAFEDLDYSFEEITEKITPQQIMDAMFKDLRQVYAAMYSDQLIARYRLIQEENKKAIEIALEMLL